MKMAMSAESRYPATSCPGLAVSGQKIPEIDNTPAVTVVTPTKHMGTIVIQAYLDLPLLIRKVVQIASAIVASNWFPVPKSGQIVEIVPV
jgi:hypothetical protein